MTQHLHDRVDELEEEVRQLRSAVQAESDDTDKYRMTFELTHAQSIMLDLLMRRPVATAEALAQVLPKVKPKSDMRDDGPLIKAHKCHLAKKLKPYGFEIKTLPGRGYYLHPDMKEKIKERVGGYCQN